jgi:hypothetical protein
MGTPIKYDGAINIPSPTANRKPAAAAAAALRDDEI